MENIIAYCGLDCSQCPAYIAKKENNNELRRKTAEEWSKQFNQTITPESVNCDGCTTMGELIGYCHICEIRKCGMDKKVANCAFCADYICDKLTKWFKNVPEAQERLDKIRISRRT